MFKRIVLGLILVFFICNTGWAVYDCGIKQASEFISVPLKQPLDSAYGIERKPDSVHIITYADNATSKTFGTRSTTFPFSDISIDTTKDYGDSLYWFVDQVQDIDGAGGNFVLAIDISMFYDKLATHTYAKVQVISDSLENMLDASKDSSASAAVLSQNNLDSFQVQDGWVAKEASLYDPATDSVIVDVSSALVTDGLLAVAADTVWEEILTGATHNTATSAGRRLRQIDAAFVLATGTAQVSGTPTDAGTYIILAAATAEGDDFFNHASVTIDGGTGVGQSRAIFDYTGATDSAALHAGDDWITDPDATSTYVISPGHPVEVMHMHDEAIDDIWEYAVSNIGTADGIGDSLMSLGDSLIDNSGTGWDSLLAALADANLAKKIWDTDIEGKLKSLVISNSAGDAVQFTSTGNDGDGLQVTGEGDGEGLKAVAGAGAGHGIQTNGGLTGSGIFADGGATSGSGIFARGAGTGSGIIGQAQGSGDGLSLATSTGDQFDAGAAGEIVDLTWDELANSHTGTAGSIMDVLYDSLDALVSSAGGVATLPDSSAGDISDIANQKTIVAVVDTNASGDNLATFGSDIDATLKSLVVSNSGGDAVQFTSTGSDGDGLQITGEGNGEGVKITGGATGDGINAAGGSSAGRGAFFHATAGANNGFQVQGFGTGTGLAAIGGTAGNSDGFTGTGYGTGHGIQGQATGSGNGFNLITVTGSYFSPEAIDEFWDEDTTGHKTDPQMGFWITQGGEVDYEKVWYDIDTLNVDTSDIGDWLKNNVGPAPTGLRTMTLIVIDTSATPDDTLPNISLEVVTSTGETYFKGNPTSGIVPVAVDDNDTILVYARGLPTFNFLGEGGSGTEIGFDSAFIVNGDTTVDVKGYRTSVSAPSNPDVCRAYVNIYDNSGSPLPGAQIFARMQATNVEDTCNLTTIGAFEIKGTISDADSGFTYIDLIKSKCLLQTTGATGVKYKIGIDYGDFIDWKFNDTIPDSATFRVTKY